MNSVKSFRAALACAALAMPVMASAQMSGPVQTQQGKVQGAPGKVEGVTVFKGIPFAAPPDTQPTISHAALARLAVRSTPPPSR